MRRGDPTVSSGRPRVARRPAVRLVLAASIAGMLVVTAGGVAGGVVGPVAPVAGPVSPNPVQMVTCPDLGTVEVALVAGMATAPLPAGVELRVSYRATDSRTGATVAGGQSTASIQCQSVPFAGLTPAQVSAGARPVGVAVDDRLTGSWLVSASVNLPASSLPQAPARQQSAADGFPFDGPVRAFLGMRAGSASVAVFDSKSGASYSLAQNYYITASIVKVDILATLLRQAQDAGRGLTPGEQATATQMIEFSDNNAATSLWNEVGGAPAVAAFNRLVGMPNTNPGPGGFWGLTTTTSSDQVRLMTIVAYPNLILASESRAYIESLMRNVTPSQRWGVSGGLPPGTSVALKNGWLPQGGGWAINSIGHVVGQGRDYVIAVLTSTNPSMGYGIGTIEGVASLVWPGLPVPVDRTGQLSVGAWYARNELTSGDADVSLTYGNPGDIPIVGDWNGDGADTPGVVRGFTWYLRNELSSGGGDMTLTYGNPGDHPIVGHWIGTGEDGIGVVRNSVWYLRNELSSGSADVAFTYGNPGDIPIVGDWTGTGTDGIGVIRGTTWYLRNELSAGPADIVLTYGNPGDKPVVGDWMGSGKDGIGVVRGATWYLNNSLVSGEANIVLSYGLPTDLPLAGEWQGGQATRPGVAR